MYYKQQQQLSEMCNKFQKSRRQLLFALSFSTDEQCHEKLVENCQRDQRSISKLGVMKKS
ncbi:hypothetical protein T07_7586 [Trichinella nelsoni]|uniref:Uncharacterized protein n=1 Tax=Trichinella nelsoni TaxID=6336 RepID=A0A0V0RG41_9BILA|nr:hypothetical protein T07_7586 [Trichinella nelsoni]